MRNPDPDNRAPLGWATAVCTPSQSLLAQGLTEHAPPDSQLEFERLCAGVQSRLSQAHRQRQEVSLQASAVRDLCMHACMPVGLPAWCTCVSRPLHACMPDGLPDWCTCVCCVLGDARVRVCACVWAYAPVCSSTASLGQAGGVRACGKGCIVA